MSKATTECKQCEEKFTPPTSAPHKKFCSTKCRVKWWGERRKQGEEVLKREREEEAAR